MIFSPKRFNNSTNILTILRYNDNAPSKTILLLSSPFWARTPYACKDCTSYAVNPVNIIILIIDNIVSKIDEPSFEITLKQNEYKTFPNCWTNFEMHIENFATFPDPAYNRLQNPDFEATRLPTILFLLFR